MRKNIGGIYYPQTLAVKSIKEWISSVGGKFHPKKEENWSWSRNKQRNMCKTKASVLYCHKNSNI